MKNKVLGVCACPLCNFPAQEVRESTAKSPKPYLTCDECGVQIFARQARSVKVLLSLIKEGVNPLNNPLLCKSSPAAIAAKPAPVAPPPKPTPAPVAPVVAPVVKPAVEQAAPAPKPERTMFDWFTE